MGQDLIDRIQGPRLQLRDRDVARLHLEARAGGVSIGGASGAENRFIIDGIQTINLQNGSSGKSVVTDFVQEVQVKTSG